MPIEPRPVSSASTVLLRIVMSCGVEPAGARNPVSTSCTCRSSKLTLFVSRPSEMAGLPGPQPATSRCSKRTNALSWSTMPAFPLPPPRGSSSARPLPYVETTMGAAAVPEPRSCSVSPWRTPALSSTWSPGWSVVPPTFPSVRQAVAAVVPAAASFPAGST